jgi:methylenetetrahydrofolate--tRNA-(uracil-5-)-methyltransferase
MKPVGLSDPRTGRRPWAVVQLRPENTEGTAYNLVGFQSRMKWGEQARVLRMIPGLEEAELLRFGSVHRNTFLNGPECLNADFSTRSRDDLRFAGQMTGVEGYIESMSVGLLAGLSMAAHLEGKAYVPPPAETALGALTRHVTGALKPVKSAYQPSSIQFGMFPALPGRVAKQQRPQQYAARALEALSQWLGTIAGGIGAQPMGAARGDEGVRP